MKRRPALLALVLLVLSALLPASPARAQLAVYDPANWIENLLQKVEAVLQTALAYEDLYHDLEDLYLAYRNLERLEHPRWRDVERLLDEIRDLSAYGEAVSYALLEPLDRFLERYPVEIVFDGVAVHQGEDARAVQRYWWETLRDTSAGAFASAARSAEDESRELNELSVGLQDLAQSAEGRDQHAHARNMMLAALLGQSQKTNSHLATLANLLAVRDAHEAALRSSAAATIDELAYAFGWDLERPYGTFEAWDPTP